MAIVAFIVLLGMAYIGILAGMTWNRQKVLMKSVKELRVDLDQTKRTIEHLDQKSAASDATLAVKLDQLIDGDKELRRLAEP